MHVVSSLARARARGTPARVPPRLRYNDEVATPALLRDFRRKLELIAKYEVDDDVARLKLAGAKKSLANELKRSDGKLSAGQEKGATLANFKPLISRSFSTRFG